MMSERGNTVMGTARQKVIKNLTDNIKNNKNVNRLVLAQSYMAENKKVPLVDQKEGNQQDR